MAIDTDGHDVRVGAPLDATPPSVPESVDAAPISPFAIQVTWAASTDLESGVSFYRVYRDGVEAGISGAASFSDDGLGPETTYVYEVSAVNGAGIESPRSDPAGATTSPGPAFDYSWDFEDGTSEGWTNGGGGTPSGFALASPGLNGSALRMAATTSSTNGNADNTYLRFVTANDAVPTSGKLNVHATIKSHGQTNARGTAFGVTDGSGPRLVNRYGYIRFQNNGQIQYKVGSVWTDVTAFAVNTEYDFLFVIDLTSSTWALRLDGVEVATGLGFSDGAATVAGEFALVLNRYSRETPTNTAQIDDISVEHVPDGVEPVASIEVTPAAATITPGEAIQLTATPKDASGNLLLGLIIVWSSGDETIATVSAGGGVNGVGPGTVTVTAVAEGIGGSAEIDVISLPVASVDVEPVSATIAVGGTFQLTAVPRDAAGTPLQGRAVTWSSSNDALAVVSVDGLATGASEGTVTIIATIEGQLGTSSLDVFVPAPGITPNLKVAFIGDQGNNSASMDVLQLISNEGADAVIHAGDLDYGDDVATFDLNVTSVLGADYPYFVSAGNHDVESNIWYGPGGYQEKLEQRLALIPDAVCTGNLGVTSSCTYHGLFFVLSGVGTLPPEPALGSTHEEYIEAALLADASDWRICSWHKNQTNMQIGGKGDEVGWGVYQTCLEHGAIIATAHEHSYARTKTLTSTEFQIVDSNWLDPDNLNVRPGATFAFVSGLGGHSVRNQQRCLPETYPYGCNGEWASIYTTNQNAQPGALFIEFYVDGDP